MSSRTGCAHACAEKAHRLAYLRAAGEHLERGGRLLLCYSQSLFIERDATAGEQSQRAAADAINAGTIYSDDVHPAVGRTAFWAYNSAALERNGMDWHAVSTFQKGGPIHGRFRIRRPAEEMAMPTDSATRVCPVDTGWQ